jgi:O-antigen/teichoic acid export membrane protein
LTLLDRLTDWSRKLLLTAGAQASVQVLGFASGLLVIRHLSSGQYAYYTIANAALGMMTVLTDSGISSGVLAQAGPVWQDASKLGSVLGTGLQIRRRLALVAVTVSIPLTLVLLRHQGADWPTALLLVASILPTFFSTVSGQLLEAVPRIHQRLLPLQGIQVGSNLGRLLALAIAVPRWPTAWVATIVTAIPVWLANWRLRRLVRRDADWGVRSDPEVRRQLLRQVRRSMPGAIYYSFSGQLTVWLISVVGRSGAVAAVGALGRIAMLLTAFTAVFSVLLIPRFARLPLGQPRLVARRFWQSLTAIAAACVVPIILLAAFPNEALSILGPQYKGLALEAIMMALSTFAAVMCGAAFSLAAARGVVAPPHMFIPIFIAMQAALVAALPLDTVVGVIAVGLLSSVGQFAFQCGYFWWHVSRRQAASLIATRVR